MIAIRILESGGLSRQVDGKEGDNEPCNIAELMRGITENRQGPRNSATNGLCTTKHETDDGDENEFIAGSSSLFLLVLEVFTVLELASVLVGKICVSDWISQLLFDGLGARMRLGLLHGLG